MSLKMFLYGKLVIGSIETLARGLRHLPGNDLARDGIRVDADVAYIDDGMVEHRLDVYMPTQAQGPWPVAVYVHGGGFKYFDKSTHWAAAAKLARRGFLTFNVNYRLAPEHPYPAAVHDVSAAMCWIAAHAKELGGDLNRVVYAGESAGGNLVLGATIAGCWRRPEAHAQAIFDAGIRPHVLLPACGYLGVSEPGRHAENAEFPAWMNDRIMQVTQAYLPDHAEPKPEHAFANPLPLLRTLGEPERPMPAVFAIVGGSDPVIGDTVALGALLAERGWTGEHKVYPGGIHAFHAAAWTELARSAWDDQLGFLDRHLPRA